MSIVNFEPLSLEQAMEPEEPLTLYSILGGEATVSIIMTQLSSRILADKVISFFVTKYDLEQANDYLTEFVSMALIHGVPKDTSLIQLALFDHLGRQFMLGLNENHFDLILGHLVLILEELNCNRAIIVEVVRSLRPLRDLVEKGAEEAKRMQRNARYTLAH